MNGNLSASEEGLLGADHVSMEASSDQTGEQPLSEHQKEKLDQIRKACNQHDHEALHTLATATGGLINDEARRIAWPLLLGCTGSTTSPSTPKWTTLKRHRDEDQVQLDVNRSFIYYPENDPPQRTESRKHELSDVITAVLRQHPILCYFQGFHDIVQVLLLVLGAEAAEPAVARLALLRIRDFMLPTLAGAESHLHLLPSILYAADAELYLHLSGASRPTPFFALAATLTLYAHDIEEYGDIARLFDFLLAHEAAMPVYLFAVIVLSRKDELLEIEQDDSDMLHFTLSKLPKPLDLEGWISRTAKLFHDFPPNRLPTQVWSRISNASVLKTTRDPAALAKQTLQDGERMFARQAKEIEQAERRKQLRIRMKTFVHRYKRRAGWTSAAVLVAVLAFYLGRNNDAMPPALQNAFSTALSFGQRTYEALQAFIQNPK